MRMMSKNERKNEQNNSRPQGKKRQKQLYTSVASVFVVSVVFLAVVAYIGESAYKFINRAPVPTVTLQSGAPDAAQTYAGVIIRDEKVYTSAAAGDVHYNYGDLDRVKKGAVVCTVQNDADVTAISRDMRKIDDNILQLQKQRGDLSVFSGDVKLKNDQITNYISDNIYNFSAGDFSFVYALKDNLDFNIDARDQMLLNENTGSLAGAAGQKAAAVQRMNSQVNPVAAGESGIVSYTLDGYENTYTPGDMDTLTPAQTDIGATAGQAARKATVKPNDGVFKIIGSNTWHIGAYLPESAVSGWKTGDYQTVYVEKNGVFLPETGRVANITGAGANAGPNQYVLLEFSKYMLDFADMRSVNIRVSNAGEDCYRVPDSAVVQRTLLTVPNNFISSSDARQVFIKAEGGVNAVSVDVCSSDETNAYVFQELGKIQTGDVLLDAVNKKETFTISAYKAVSGVYVVNAGFARFVEVTPDAGGSGGCVSLQVNTNKALHAYDNIVADARNITDGQKIIK